MPHAHRDLERVLAEPRVRSHCRFRKRGAEYVNESGMKWISGRTTRQSGRALAEPCVDEVGLLDRPHVAEGLAAGAGPPLGAAIHSNALNNSHARMHLCARSAEMET